MPKQSPLELGKKLKFLRFQINASQQDIAKKLEISQQAYSYLENGKTQFTELLLEKICTIFDVSFHEFISIRSQSINDVQIPKTKDGQLDIYATQVIIANLKKQLIEKELRIVQLELQLKTKRKEQEPNSLPKPVYVLI